MKKTVSLVLALACMASLTVSANAVNIQYENSKGETIRLSDFRDTKNHWAHDTILKCADYELVAGYQGNFMPDRPITRGDLCVILDRMIGLRTVSYNIFYDLPNDAYYRDPILRCLAAGYIAGTSANTVSPQGYATREQVAVIICRMFNIDTDYYSYTGFKDDGQIGAWAKPSVAAMKRLGYMNGTGDNRFKPKANITRAELITIINNIASTYIPRSDRTNQGTDFKGTFPKNLMTCRNINLRNSIIGRDVILTNQASEFNAVNSTITGRILVMGRANMNLKNTLVTQIRLCDGKSDITGISDKIQEVYVGKYASETNLDNFPVRLVLESGVRVRVKDKMYENETLGTKVYLGQELLEDLAAEQGYVVGGPKVRGAKFKQDHDNMVSVENVQVIRGDSKIDEIGVIWLDQHEDEDTKNPTYQNCDGKKVYETNKLEAPFGFDVQRVTGKRAYRVYVKDTEGKFAYGNTSIFEAYDYNMSFKIYDTEKKEYPEKVDVEIVFRGEKLPDLSNIRVVYDTDEMYSDKHKEVTLRKYTEHDAENPIDDSKYRRYYATIVSDSKRVDGETVVTPPTNFGYIITFRDGSIMNRFPVLTNVLPEGVSPMKELKTGSARYDRDGNITIYGNRVSSRYVIPQEMGIVYKISDEENITKPELAANGWQRTVVSNSIGVNESTSFDNTILHTSDKGNTFYAAYVKTSNGYWYGDVKKISNDVKGDEDGYFIQEVKTDVLGNGEVLLTIITDSENLPSSTEISLGDDLGYGTLGEFEQKVMRNNTYIVLRGLEENKVYNLPIRLFKENGSKSNLYNVTFETKNPLKAIGKTSEGNNTKFSLVFSKMPNELNHLEIAGISLEGMSETVKLEDAKNFIISLSNKIDTRDQNIIVKLHDVIAYGHSYNISYDFNVVVPLY